MRPSVRWPVSLALLGSTAIALVLAGTYLFASVRAEFLRSSEANLRANAESIASLMGSHMDQTALTAFERNLIVGEMKRLSSQVGARLCVVNWRGDVLEDSQPEGDGQLNLKALPEVEEALNGRYGSHVRDSQLFVAVPMKAHGKHVGAVYGTRSLAELESMLGELRRRLLLAGSWALGLSALLSMALAGFLIRPVRRLAHGVERVSGGDYAFRLNLQRGDELGLLGRDIDGMAQRLEQHRNLLMQFVSDASHELKTPIASLKALSEALLDGGLEDAKAGPRFVGLMHDEVERMERLVGDMLVLQRGDSGTPLDPQPFDLKILVDDMQERLRQRGESGLRNDLTTTLEITADRHRLSQVLTNLLENALVATRSCVTPSVFVEVQQTVDAITVKVVDNGPGVAAGERERIFERFYRLDQGRSRHQGGSGLGLAICRQIVETHGGRIWVEEAPGGGAIFSFTLPRSQGE